MNKHPTAPSIAELYHELTKYSPEKLSSSVLDPLEKPALFKEYLSERGVDLKPYLKSAPQPEGGAESASATLRTVSRLLYHMDGVTEIIEGRGGTAYLRAAPSAGALYPVEIYLATRGVPELKDGIHGYSARRHGLVPVWEGDFGKELGEFTFRHPAALRARMCLILTGVFRRSAWRYGDRAYRRILLDTGHVLGNALAYAPVEGLSVVSLGSFYDAAVSDLLFLDSREEAVMVMAPLLARKELEALPAFPLYPHPSPRNTPPAGAEEGWMHLLHERSGIMPQPSLRPRPEHPLAPSAADGGVSGDPAIALAGGAGEAADALAPSIGPVIRRRRSTRAFEKGPVGWGRLSGILRSAYAPARAAVPLDRGLIDPSMISTHLVAVRVEGLDPGIYRLDLRNMALVPRRKGKFQTELWNLCLGQELGRDAAAAIIHVADLPACVERHGDRAYRYLHLDAGHLGERINLAAVSREVGVSGIGGFFDEEVNQLLDLPERVSTLYITLLGLPQPRAAKE